MNFFLCIYMARRPEGLLRHMVVLLLLVVKLTRITDLFKLRDQTIVDLVGHHVVQSVDNLKRDTVVLGVTLEDLDVLDVAEELLVVRLADPEVVILVLLQDPIVAEGTDRCNHVL